MNLCSHHHDEICYDGRDCPLCAKMTEMDEALSDKDKEIKSLVSDAKDAEARIAELEHEIEEPLLPAMERAQQHPVT